MLNEPGLEVNLHYLGTRKLAMLEILLGEKNLESCCLLSNVVNSSGIKCKVESIAIWEGQLEVSTSLSSKDLQ